MAQSLESFNPLIDRYDRRRADWLFNSLWPDVAVSRAVAENLATSIRVAHDAADAAWGITMHPASVRLNVGQVETLTFWPQKAHVFFQSPLPSELKGQFELSEADAPFYSSVPVPSGYCVVPASVLTALPAELRKAHETYIRTAASFKRVSPFKRSYSPAVLEHVEAVLNISLPRPSYVATDEIGFRVEPCAEEIDASTLLIEGARYQVVVNAYERNPIARSRCIAHYGASR